MMHSTLFSTVKKIDICQINNQAFIGFPTVFYPQTRNG